MIIKGVREKDYENSQEILVREKLKGRVIPT